MKNCYETLLEQAISCIDQISDPKEKVVAIASILPHVCSYTNPVVSESQDVAEVPVVKERKKRTPKAKKEEEVAQETPIEAEEVKQEETKFEMIKPTTEDVAEIKEAVNAEILLTLPQETDTEDVRQQRQLALIKKYGDVPLKEVFSNEEINQYLAFEFNGLNALVGTLQQCFGVSFDDEGNEVDAGPITAAAIQELVQFYIHEVDDTKTTYEDVTLDKFLTTFVPYMQILYNIYQYTGEQICAAGQDMRQDPNDQFTPDKINVSNAECLLEVLKEQNK